MKTKNLFLSIVAVVSVFSIQSCSKAGDSIIDEPQIPVIEEPQIPVENDTVAIKLVPNLSITEETLMSRAENSRDLIGVEITRKVSGSEWNAGVPTSVIYASGVFDNIDEVVFKFVRGGKYIIKMTYYPDAKDFVYKYSDGTFGAPFSYLFGLTSYKLNKPVYYSGVEGGWSGDNGPTLGYIHDAVYQPKNDRTVQSFKRGKTPRYSGVTEELTINDDTNINIKLELCLMAITLKPENFNEGKLSLVFRNNGYMSPDDFTWVVTPGDDKIIKFQIPFGEGEESLELFYTNNSGEKYLLATKQLRHKYNANCIFSFNLTERADGSIGIQMPTEDSMIEEESSFDF